MAKHIKRIKENVTATEYKKLMNFVRGSESMRENTKLNLLRAFTLLFYTGMRVNETQSLKIAHIKELIKEGTVKVEINKTSTERKLYLSNDFKKDLLKVFDLSEDGENRVISKGANKNRKSGITNVTFIAQINKVMKEVLGNGYTSHSFRQGLITEMAQRSVNTKVISQFIGHKDIKTTLGYVTPSENDIKNALVR